MELFVPCPDHSDSYTTVRICGNEQKCTLKWVNFTVSKLHNKKFFFTRDGLTPVAFGPPKVSVREFLSPYF